MAAQRPLFRIVLNVVLDGLLAAVAVPLAHLLADPLAAGRGMVDAGLAAGGRRRRACCWPDCRSGCPCNTGALPASAT